MARRRKEVLAKPEIIEAMKDAIDELLSFQLAKIEDMKEPAKTSTANNLKKYYDAQKKVVK